MKNFKMPFKIAHISDTHISPEHNRNNIRKLKLLLSYIVDSNYDHIAITGDITSEGSREEFSSVRRLLKHFDLLHIGKLSVVVGNHDIFGGVHRAEDLLSFSNKCRRVNYGKQLGMFQRAFKELYPKDPFRILNLYPYVKIVDQVALIGINSTSFYHRLLNPVGSNGQVDNVQLEALSGLLSHPVLKDYSKIILIHHHFNKYDVPSDGVTEWLYRRFEAMTLKLHGSRKLLKLFSSKGVSAVLHGHTHIIGAYRIQGIAFSCTALIPLNNDNEKLHFNEVTVLNQDDVTISPVVVNSQKSPAHTLENIPGKW